MKKVISVIMALIMLLSLAACGQANNTSDKQTPILMSVFEATLKGKDYEVKKLEVVPHNDNITEAKGISVIEKSLKLTYYNCANEKEAQKQYSNRYQNAKVLPTSSLKMKTTKGENWSFFESSDKGYFNTAIQIDNMVVFGSCEEKYKDELIELMKDLECWVDVKEETK